MPIANFNSRSIGDGLPVVVIAEIGVNHNGDVDLALRHMREAAAAGADAVKFQTFRSSDVVTDWAPSAEYQRNAVGVRSQLEMIKPLELKETAFATFIEEGERLGVITFSTPFDVASVELLARLGVEWMKIPSGEVNNHELVSAVGATGLPTFLSTGMATLPEIHAAVDVHQRSGGGPLVIFHCVSSYPAPLEQMNLRAIRTLMSEFGVPVGLSDHSIGRDAAVAAVALGACALEKHFTVDRTLPGPDQAISMEPADLSQMIDVIRRLEGGGLGSGVKEPVPAELPIRAVARRSVVAAREIAAGATIARDMLAMKRPGGGIPPDQIDQVVGKRARRHFAPDEPIALDAIE